MNDPCFVRARTCWASSRFRLDEETWATADGEVVRPVIHHPGAVAILAQPDAGTIVMVRQWRYSVRRWTWEIPAGTREPGEPPEATARRELAEEAGFDADRWVELLRLNPAAGVSDEEMILFRAEGLVAVPARPDRGELVRGQVLPLSAVRDLLAAREPFDAKTLVALALIGLRPDGRYPL